MNDLINGLAKLLADTYSLYLKTQNYHWNVESANFKLLHEMFEEQYKELAEAVDIIAERIRTLGYHAPATFEKYIELTSIMSGRSDLQASEMINDLANSHKELTSTINYLIEFAEREKDVVTIDILTERLNYHYKIIWFLNSSK